jgi:hypothetical protein
VNSNGENEENRENIERKSSNKKDFDEISSHASASIDKLLLTGSSSAWKLMEVWFWPGCCSFCSLFRELAACAASDNCRIRKKHRRRDRSNPRHYAFLGDT